MHQAIVQNDQFLNPPLENQRLPNAQEPDPDYLPFITDEFRDENGTFTGQRRVSDIG